MQLPSIGVTILGIATALVLCAAGGAVARLFRQPAVIGEIAVGILIGPTFFGGSVADVVLPTSVRPALETIANIGIVLFMFLLGVHLDRRMIRRQIRSVAPILVGSIALPFVCGLGLAAWLSRASEPAPTAPFYIFVATAMTVTALPVLARVLKDQRIEGTTAGVLSLSLAAAGDAVAWALLAVAVALAQPGVGLGRSALIFPLVLVLFLGVPKLLRSARLSTASSETMVLWIIVGALCAAAATDWMGLHLLLGAFLFGASIPQDGALQVRAGITQKITPVSGLLSPLYFLIAGMSVSLPAVGVEDLIDFMAVMCAAVAGKFIGVYVAARLVRHGKHLAATLATLMNIRGLTEIVLLSIGLKAGLVDSRVYSMLVLMAVATTLLAPPLLRVLQRSRNSFA